jgi:hypothetical protein
LARVADLLDRLPATEERRQELQEIAAALRQYTDAPYAYGEQVPVSEMSSATLEVSQSPTGAQLHLTYDVVL